ncbi:cupin domain-containing protein [Herbaspirillum sp. WKF16]|jgi:anti-sigma factor ChrR (cupin superfamily)|uniref:cupin domain-containing protein n=1 Tax=Herbaspirillum sp. WKF16 TaxID=3028312 RepID=UPI0023A9B4AA|nr:cupin domain-containing protein [Herbaspirillum sp. WKF16]WDZ94861.1 cupin domain-containing protein [Herbaspirillum sp. WKF16]
MTTQRAPSFDERLTGKPTPTVGGSTYVRPQDMEWKPSQFEGVDIKVLYEDKAAGEMTCLLRWAPGTQLPMHKHAELEQSYVLAGSFSDHDGIARAGEYVWRSKDSLHETYSEEGCVILAIYRKPNIFKNSAGFDAAGGKRIATRRKPA